MLKKRFLSFIIIAAVLTLTACGKSDDGSAGTDAEPKLAGTLSEIMDSVYENADLADEVRDAMATEYTAGDLADLPVETTEYLLGTADLEYTEGYYSLPLMNVVPYQLLLLRLPEDADADAAKQLLSDNADPRKWICVEAESVVVENVGDVVLFVMGDTETTNALRTAFLALGE